MTFYFPEAQKYLLSLNKNSGVFILVKALVILILISPPPSVKFLFHHSAKENVLLILFGKKLTPESDTAALSASSVLPDQFSYFTTSSVQAEKPKSH